MAQNANSNHFSSISKGVNFRVLQFYPPYDESHPRDSEDGDQRDMDTLALDLLHFPKTRKLFSENWGYSFATLVSSKIAPFT